MFSHSKQRAFIPLVLTGILLFGAVAAEAHDYHRRGDRTAKGAAIGAVAGTLFQIMQGRTEGEELLAGAVVGGTLGAAVGAGTDDLQYRYHDGYRGGHYDHDGYYQDGYYRDGYYRDDYRDDYRYDDDRGSYRDRDRDYYRDGDRYRNDGYYDRYDRRSSHRHDSYCNHH